MGGTQECVPRNYGMGALSRSLLQLSPWIVGKAAVDVADKSTLTTPPPPKTTHAQPTKEAHCHAAAAAAAAAAVL
jgi:hypothetical protein